MELGPRIAAALLTKLEEAGLVHRQSDQIELLAPPDSIEEMIAKVAKQRDVVIDRHLIEGADHFYGTQLEELDQAVVAYLDRRMKEIDAELAKAEEA